MRTSSAELSVVLSSRTTLSASSPIREFEREYRRPVTALKMAYRPHLYSHPVRTRRHTFAGLSTSANTSPHTAGRRRWNHLPRGHGVLDHLSERGTIPTADINSVSSGLLKYVPAYNKTTVNPVTGKTIYDYVFNATETQSRNQYLYRIDQVFNSKDSLWGTWFNESVDNVQEPVSFFGGNLPGFGETDGEHWKFLTLSWSHVFNDRMVNELRGGYNRFQLRHPFSQIRLLPPRPPDSPISFHKTQRAPACPSSP